MQSAGVSAEIRICTQCRASYREPSLRVCPRDGAPLIAWVDDPMIGVVLGDRYQLVEPLGQGGMGSVYLAERLPDELEVAVKIVRPEHANNPTVHERFLREVRHTSSISSPHVVRIIDSGMSEDGRAFMVMERLLGESLTERMRRSPPLRPTEALLIARDVARALWSAHKSGVIHRDLKPDNIYLCRGGIVKVLDFGIAKAFVPESPHRVSEPSLTEAHRVVGTPVYMSPEVITKEALTPASDLYSLGVILYEMLTGVPPFYEKDAIGTMYRHLHEPPRRLREAQKHLDIPSALEALVRDLLVKETQRRPSDAAKVAGRIEALIRVMQDRSREEAESGGGDVTTVYDPSTRVKTGGPPTPAKKKRKVGWLVAAAAVALLIGFGATAAILWLLRLGVLPS